MNLPDADLQERVRYGLERARELIATNDSIALGTCLNIILTDDPDQPPKGDFFGLFARLEPTLAQGFDALEEQIKETFLTPAAQPQGG